MKKINLIALAIFLVIAMLLPSLASCSRVNPDAINPKFNQGFSDVAGSMGKKFSGDYTGFLGYGYNIVGSGYFNSGDVSAKAEWLKIDEMVKDGYVYTAAVSDTKSTMFSGTTLKEFQQSVSNTVGLEFSYGLFSKVSGDFSLSTSNTENVTEKSVFIKNQIILQRERQYINTGSLTMNSLKKYVNEGILEKFNADTTKMSAGDRYNYYKNLFVNYGTHIMIDIINGGRMDLNYVYNNKESMTLKEIEASVNLTYSYIAGSASASTDTSIKTKVTNFMSNTTFQCHRVGGTIQGDIMSYEKARESYTEWNKSISDKDTLALVDLGDNAMTSLIPVWDLIDNNTAKENVKKAFSDYLTETGKLFADIDNKLHNAEPEYFIKNIYIGSHGNSSRALSDLYATISKAEPNVKYKVVLEDLNKGAGGDFIYIGYTFTTDPNEAITDLGMEWWSKESSKKSTLTSNKNIVYTIINNDLNRGAKGKWVYLFYTKDKRAGAPIKEIGVENNGKFLFTDQKTPPVGWEAVYSIPNPSERIDCNKGCGSKTDDIFLWFLRSTNK